MKPIFLALLAVASTAGCPSGAPTPDAGAPDRLEEATRATLIRADCAHLAAMGCSGAKETPGGHSCAEREAAEVDAGVAPSWACRARATTCAAVDACR